MLVAAPPLALVAMEVWVATAAPVGTVATDSMALWPANPALPAATVVTGPEAARVVLAVWPPPVWQVWMPMAATAAWRAWAATAAMARRGMPLLPMAAMAVPVAILASRVRVVWPLAWVSTAPTDRR